MRSTPLLTRRPPRRADVDAALARLDTPRRTAAAAVHLALPIDTAPAIACRRDGAVWHWRDATATTSDDPARLAADLATRGRRNGDVFFDLTARRVDPSAWVKPLRSGHMLVAFGSAALLGVGRVAADPVLGETALRELVALVAADPDRLDVGVVELDGQSAIVARDERGFLAHGAHTGAEAPPQREPDLQRLADDVRHTLSARRADIEVLGTRLPGTLDVEVHCDLGGGWEVIVPATVAAGSVALGVDETTILHRDPPARAWLPPGLAWRGEPKHDDGVVADSDALGVPVLVRDRRYPPDLLGDAGLLDPPPG